MFIIGIAGGTGSGKTTVVRKIIDNLPPHSVAVIPQDSYYVDSGHIPLAERQKINFDHPSSLEFPLLVKHIKALKAGKAIEQPTYSYLTCTRNTETVNVKPTKVIIVEGILIFTDGPLRDLMDIKVYVDAEPDDRLSRVIKRDIEERGRVVEQVLERYYETVKPMHIQFIEPTKRYADIIVPQGGNNSVAINVLTTITKERLALQ
ncbi:MAG: uridine kinase [Bacteroidales bacterium]|nr:uridine kinase [Bacteroidales bacterium]MCF8389699.1 uridine kinase [Bacteroidales bacterium]